MHLPHPLQRAALAAAVCALAVAALPSASAQGTSYTGNFTDDDAQFSLSFSFAATDTLIARTLSYGGGFNGLGQGVAAGGFAPVLSLFDEAGLLLASAAGSANLCSTSATAADPASGFCWDASLNTVLSAGHYTMVLTQDGNLPLGPFLADGFLMTGTPDYTGLAYLGAPGLRFINADASQRSGHWAFDINVTSPVDEPATPLLMCAGLLAAALRLRRLGM